MSNTVNLRMAEPNENNESLLSDIGTFRFIADRARPDILTACGEISTGGDKNPSDFHLKTSERIKHYLNNTKDLYIKLGGLGLLILFGYSDASYITDGNCKSRLGGCVYLGFDSGAIHSFSKNDTRLYSTLSHSSMEAEIKAIDELTRVMLHIMDLVKFICGEIQLPIKIYTDTKSGISLLETLKTNNKVKHINLRVNFIRELINDRIIEIHFVKGNNNVADILTKALPNDQFEKLRNVLMLGHNGIDPSIFNDSNIVHQALTATSMVEFDLGECVDNM
jgi:hypothetical protein